jgi:GT2 family glycosyltransferase
MQTIPSRGVDEMTIIVVTYNSAHCIPELSRTLVSMPHVVIVDNASDDDTVMAVARMIPNARLIRNSSNLGFGAANNVALREVKTPYALLLNPDCVPETGFFEKMIEKAAMFPDAAIIAPQLIRRGNVPEISYRWPSVLWESRGPAPEGPCCVGFVCGAVMLFNMHAMKEVGFFDEAFFLYYEDEDLCQRAFNLKKNIVVVPDVFILHLSRGSVRGNFPLRGEYLRGYHHAQSKLIYEKKHVRAGGGMRLRRLTLLLAFATMIPRLLIPQPRYLARLLGRIRGLIAYK